MANIRSVSETDFVTFIKKFGKKLGVTALVPLFAMWAALRSKNTPQWAKTVILGAIAYALSPIDAIPDFLPLVGLTDDIGVIAAAFAQVAMHIDKEVLEESRQKVDMLLAKFD